MTNPSDPTSTLLISHIPKTAGTSLASLIHGFDSEAVFLYNGELALGAPDIGYIATFRSKPPPRVIMGHFSYGVHRFLGVAPRYATVLREPVARVVSLYRHLRLGAKTPLGDRLRAGLSLADFVACGETEMSNNHYCRCIAGVPPDAGLIINARWLLDLALHNLSRHYVAVGTVENMELAVEDLGRVLSWQPPEMPRLNVATDEAPVLDETTLDIVRAFNALDIALYDQVCNASARSARAPRRDESTPMPRV